ncbi:urease accessory protein UreD [Paenibacillus solisilvae]|uniref:Urease accessory protein UreD n=1 Tax=Paenibacillus solisilvae TaxID=2486751 RepID=A0ABW0W6N5_9BACL
MITITRMIIVTTITTPMNTSMSMALHTLTKLNQIPAARVSNLRASFVNKNGQTLLASKYHTAPIKIAKAFPLNGPVGVIVMDVSPGLLAGDRYELDWRLGADAHLYVTNQSFTKVHPCLELSRGASLSQTFQLAPGAIVESMPEPIMLFKDAVFINDTEVELASGSVWMQAEVLCPGRTLRGEQFVYRAYRNRLKVNYEGQLIFAQNQFILPETQHLSAPGCFDKMTHTGVFYAFSDRITNKHIESVRTALDNFSTREGHPVLTSISVTHKHGLAVMAAGTAAWSLQEVLRCAWQALRLSLLGMEPLRLGK